MEYPLRIAEIEVSQAAADERIVGLFRYDSESGGRKGPSLLIMADIASTLYAYEQLLDALNAAAEQTRTLLSGTGVDPMARFEKLVERLNEAVAEFVEREPSELAWHRVNLFIIEVLEGRVCVAGIGQLSNIFLQKQADGTYRSFDLLGSLDMPAEINPRKPFASILCGDLRNGDVLFLGTNNFERLRGELGIAQRLKTLPPVTAALELKQDLERRGIPDDFAGVVVAQVATSTRIVETPVVTEPRSTSSIEKMHSEEKKTEEILAPSITPPKPAMTLVGLWARAKDALKRRAKLPNRGAGRKNPVSMASMRGMNAGHGNILTTDRKRTLLIGVAILLILGGSGAWFYSRQRFQAEQQLWNTVFDQATDKKTRAESDLVYGNEERTRTLMAEAQQLLADLDEKTGERKAAKQGLSNELNDLALKLKREQKIVPKELASASLGAAESSLVSPAFKDGKAYVMDLAGSSLVEFNPLNQETKRYRLPDGTARVTSVAAGANGLYLITDAKTMLSFDPKTGAYLSTSWTTKASSTQGLVLYGRRFYVLDTLANMIWRYAPVGAGVAQETAYLKQNSSSLADAAGMAIDANVYVAWKNGTIRRYLSGAEESWAPVTIDPPLQNASGVWTAAETDRVVVSDPVGKRVLVFRKDGRLVAQLIADSWTGPTAVSGDEVAKKLYVVDGNKLWQVDLP
jgi:sugar lactone lactonase YvrE